jgi:hypothetical protein
MLELVPLQRVVVGVVTVERHVAEEVVDVGE